MEGTQQQQHGETRVELAMIGMVYRITGSRYRVDRSSATPRTHTHTHRAGFLALGRNRGWRSSLLFSAGWADEDRPGAGEWSRAKVGARWRGCSRVPPNPPISQLVHHHICSTPVSNTAPPTLATILLHHPRPRVTTTHHLCCANAGSIARSLPPPVREPTCISHRVRRYVDAQYFCLYVQMYKATSAAPLEIPDSP